MKALKHSEGIIRIVGELIRVIRELWLNYKIKYRNLFSNLEKNNAKA